MKALFTRSRLRRRILAWSFVPTAVILFAVAVVAVYAYGRVTEQQAIQRNQELARLSAANLAAEINQFALDLGSLTRQADIAGNQPAQQEAALAAASNKLSIFDAGTIVLDSHGTFVAAWPARPERCRSGLVVPPLLRPALALVTTGLLGHQPRTEWRARAW